MDIFIQQIINGARSTARPAPHPRPRCKFRSDDR
jgi:hypothetical protein